MIKKLLQITSLFLLLVSCKSFVPEGAVQMESHIKTIENNYFADAERDYVYRAKIEAYGNEFRGLLILKKIENQLHRIVLTTDFGFKLIDVEVSQTTFKVNHIAAQLDRKIILKTLEQDFKTLVKPSFTVCESFETARFHIFKAKEGKSNYFIFSDKETNQLHRILQTAGSKEKINLMFEGKNNTFAATITLSHKDLKRSIYLNQFTD